MQAIDGRDLAAMTPEELIELSRWVRERVASAAQDLNSLTAELNRRLQGSEDKG